jgi:anti-sigma factor RsiW
MDPLDPRFQKISDYVDGLLCDEERHQVEQLLEEDLEALEYFEQMQERLFEADGVVEVTPLQCELTRKVLSRLDQRKKLQGGAAAVAALAMAAFGVFSMPPAGDSPQSLAFKPTKPRVLDMVARSYLLTDRSPVDPYEILLSPEREAEADLRNK